MPDSSASQKTAEVVQQVAQPIREFVGLADDLRLVLLAFTDPDATETLGSICSMLALGQARLVDLSTDTPSTGPLGGISAAEARSFESSERTIVFFASDEWSPELCGSWETLLTEELFLVASGHHRQGYLVCLPGPSLLATIETLSSSGVGPQAVISDERCYFSDIDWSHGVVFSNELSSTELKPGTKTASIARASFYQTSIE